MRLQPTSFRTQLINSLLALSAGNFVIGKRHQQLLWRYLIHHKTYTGSGQTATVTISASSVPERSNILTGGAATQTNAGTHAV
jgi:hypothetical protein